MSVIPRLFYTFSPLTRLIISLGCAVFVSGLLPSWLRLPTPILCIWNSSAYVFLGLTWWKMLKATAEENRSYAQREYKGRLVIYTFIVFASCMSMLVIASLLNYHEHGLLTISLPLRVMLASMTIFSPCLLVHT